MAQQIRIYQYAKCSTCRKALKFLDAHKVRYEARDITTQPPSKAELKRMVAYFGGEFKRLFNTSGLEYRARKISAKLPKMTASQAVSLLASSGRLIKRPFVLTDRTGLVGFKENDWKKVF